MSEPTVPSLPPPPRLWVSDVGVKIALVLVIVAFVVYGWVSVTAVRRDRAVSMEADRVQVQRMNRLQERAQSLETQLGRIEADVKWLRHRAEKN